MIKLSRRNDDMASYKNITEGKFICRPNRFIAHVEIDGKIEICHVKNTGRCRELLTEGARVFLEKSDNPSRKTKYDLIAVCKGSRLINMDSQIPNKVAVEYLNDYFKDITLIKPETVYENSRFDVYIETKTDRIFVEVKGVTLEQDGIVRFPDAPTERGTKHVNELIKAVGDGYKAYVLFVIQMSDVDYFTPNDATDKQFADALRKAAGSGVNILAVDCNVTPDSITAGKPIRVVL